MLKSVSEQSLAKYSMTNRSQSFIIAGAPPMVVFEVDYNTHIRSHATDGASDILDSGRPSGDQTISEIIIQLIHDSLYNLVEVVMKGCAICING